MKHLLRKSLLIALMAAVTTSTLAAREALPNQNYRGDQRFDQYVYVQPMTKDYFQYTNSRYGMSVYVPSSFYLAYTPSNHDGAIFKDGLGGSLTLSGSHNINGETLEQSYAEDVARYAPTYKVIGDDWYVISYERNGYIYYAKTFISSRYRNHLVISYPASNRDAYESKIPTIESTMIPSWRNTLHPLG